MEEHLERRLLKGEMIKKGITQKDMAKALGIAVSTLIRKIDNDTLTVADLRIMSDLLGWDNVRNIFFEGWPK